MTLYLDTSVLVSALSNEDASDRVRDWLGEQRADLAISDWVVAEFASALSSKVRSNKITAAEQAHLFVTFDRIVASFERVGVVPHDMALAARLCRRAELGLRTPDALHVALCRRSGHVLCTLDKVMAAAAEAIGVPVERP